MPTHITFTSDFGNRDYYLAMIKGTVLQQCPEVTLVDISHNVHPYDIVGAAFILKNTWHHFPKGTIHVLSVNDYSPAAEKFLVTHYKDHYFITPDNGLLSLLFEHTPENIYQIKPPTLSNFPIKDIIASGIHHITRGLPLSEIGHQVFDVEKRISIQPVITADRIQGAVVYVDEYENVITNISKEMFIRARHDRTFSVLFKRHDPVRLIHRKYQDVQVGSTLCLFNSADFLEIAVNMGKASTLLDLKLDDAILIDFHTASNNPS